MHRACGSETLSMPASEVIDLHQLELAKARAAFKEKKLMGDKDDIDKKLENLMQVGILDIKNYHYHFNKFEI